MSARMSDKRQSESFVHDPNTFTTQGLQGLRNTHLIYSQWSAGFSCNLSVSAARSEPRSIIHNGEKKASRVESSPYQYENFKKTWASVVL